jgi:signal transduction histidine kinase
VAPRLDERASKRLQSALRQTVRLNDLVNNLLDIGRIAAGRLTLEPDLMDLALLAKDCAERFGEEAARVGSPITLTIEGEEGERLRGKWDRLRLEQVVSNLLSNALKYGNGGPIDLKIEGRESTARIQVRDRGIGIPPERQGRIFDRFERAVSARHYGGLGMGLYITRQIVEAHGGSIVVASEVGEGSTFTISLPRRVADEEQPPNAEVKKGLSSGAALG